MSLPPSPCILSLHASPSLPLSLPLAVALPPYTFPPTPLFSSICLHPLRDSPPSLPHPVSLPGLPLSPPSPTCILNPFLSPNFPYLLPPCLPPSSPPSPAFLRPYPCPPTSLHSSLQDCLVPTFLLCIHPSASLSPPSALPCRPPSPACILPFFPPSHTSFFPHPLPLLYPSALTLPSDLSPSRTVWCLPRSFA